MAHFARIENGKVTDIQVVHNSLEHRGEDYLANELGLGGRWIQTSYNGNIRANFAGVDYTYDEVNDVFYSPQPYPSWVLNSQWKWESPEPIPAAGDWDWDEESLSWKQIN